MSAMVPQITSMVPFYDVIMSEDHPIAGPYGRDVDVTREFKVGVDVCCIQYPVTFDRDISIIYISAFSAFSLDFFPVWTSQMIILQVHIRSKNTCCLVASLWKWTFRYDNGLVSTGWQTVFVSSAIHFSDDWIHNQKNIVHYRYLAVTFLIIETS